LNFFIFKTITLKSGLWLNDFCQVFLFQFYDF